MTSIPAIESQMDADEVAVMADSTCINCGRPLEFRERSMCAACCDEWQRDSLHEQSGVGPLEPKKGK